MLIEEAQNKFLQYIYDENQDICKNIKNPDRLKIYKNNIFITLEKNLSSKYETICKFVGKEFFNYLKNEYIKKYKSTSGNLDNYGEYLFEFLQEFKPTKNFKYLPDIAKINWYEHLLYLASDEILNIEFTDINNSKHKLSKDFYLLESNYLIIDMMNLNIEDNNIDLNNFTHKSYIIIYRHDFLIKKQYITKDEFKFLKNAQGSNSYISNQNYNHL